MGRDQSLDTLLLLAGEMFVIGENIRVKFEVKKIQLTAERPHGLGTTP
jgi:hypothetical protein